MKSELDKLANKNRYRFFCDFRFFQNWSVVVYCVFLARMLVSTDETWNRSSSYMRWVHICFLWISVNWNTLNLYYQQYWVVFWPEKRRKKSFSRFGAWFFSTTANRKIPRTYPSSLGRMLLMSRKLCFHIAGRVRTRRRRWVVGQKRIMTICRFWISALIRFRFFDLAIRARAGFDVFMCIACVYFV